MELSAHEAALTRDCKTANCDGVAVAERGPYAGLCGVCTDAKRLEMGRVQRASHERRAPEPTPTQGGSFESKAKTLLPVAKTLDRAVASYKRKKAELVPAENVLKQAMAEWKGALRQLIGEEEAA